MPRRVLLIGANGQLGFDIASVLSNDCRFALTGFNHNQLEVCRKDSVAAAIDAVRPDIVVNTAAFHNLDRCEEEPDRAFEVNAIAIKGLCDVCTSMNATLVHFSTDYVYEGSARIPYAESDQAWPVNIYGTSKLAGEAIIRATLEKHYILRVSGLYGKIGPRGKGLNFPDLMVKLAKERGELKVVDDQVLTPTATISIAHRLPGLFDRVPYGLYHFTDEGECSWFDFAKKVLELTGVPAKIFPVKTGFFGEKTRRPHYSVLSKEKIRPFFAFIPLWEKSLEEYIRTREND